MMGKNHSDSNLHKRKKVKPYIRWDKETDEWECRSYVEYEIIKEEPLEIKEAKMPRRELLDSISRSVITLKDKKDIIRNPNMKSDLETIDNWLTLEYEMLNPEYEPALQGHLSGDYEINCVDGG